MTLSACLSSELQHGPTLSLGEQQRQPNINNFTWIPNTTNKWTEYMFVRWLYLANFNPLQG